MIATTKRALICGAIVLILGAAVMGAYHYMQSTAPRYSFIDKKGRKVIIEELSYFDGLDKTYGKIYKPSDDTTGNRPLLIFSHGLGVNADFGAVYCETAASLGWYAYAFDYKGGSVQSRSAGSTLDMTIKKEKDELLKIIKRLSKLSAINKSQIYVMGHSQGGLVAAMAAAESPKSIAGMILVAPAMNISELMNDIYEKKSEIKDTTVFCTVPLGKKYVKEAMDLNTYKGLGRYDKDVMIVYGTHDEIIPEESMVRLAEEYKKSDYRPVQGSSHNFSGAGQNKLINLLTEFIKNH